VALFVLGVWLVALVIVALVVPDLIRLAAAAPRRRRK
jgi:hypothetical protein